MIRWRELRGERSGGYAVFNVSRREFLKQTGLATGGLVLGVGACSDDSDEAAKEADGGGDNVDAGRSTPDGGTSTVREPTYTELDTFVSIGDDGSVQLVVHRSEMGQGVRTSCAMLLAEELGCAWEDVRVVQAVGDPKYGDQNTDGSMSMRVTWEPLRKAGASAREMLIAAAAAQLDVDPSELRAEGSRIVHDASDRSLGFAELAADAASQEVPADPPLKSAGDYAIIGKPRVGVDVRDIVRGAAVYGADVEIDGMLYASIERSPTLGGTIVTYDGQAARDVPGVVDVVELEGNGTLTSNGVAVIAENTWAALKGRMALGVEWAPASDLEQTAEHRAMLQDTVGQDGTAVLEAGDFDAAMADADRVVEAHYDSPYLAHAPMEPLVAVADVRDGAVEVWAPTQDPQRLRMTVAPAAGVQAADVTVHVTLLGGGFGRKSQPDFALEAVSLSKQVGAPIKLQWTREDEIQHGFYRPESCQRLRATIDASGAITGIAGHSAFSSVLKVFSPTGLGPLAFEYDQGWSNLPFRVDNVKMEVSGVPSGLRIGWLRSVCNTFHAFAVCSFVDELAQETGADGVAIYRTLLGDPRELPFMDYTYETGRMNGVIDAVSQMGLWGTSVPDGEGIGFAAHMSFQSYVACAVHVAVDAEKKLSIKQVDYAVDCGTVVNPDGVEAQVEGGMVFGLSAALFGEIEVADGAVMQSNFHDYPMLRIEHMPEVNVRIVDSSAPPTGVGEPPTPPIAPALANAIFAATGERLRSLPIVRPDGLSI